MSIDTKPRDFSYINHRNNYPLELKGTMKAHRQPQQSYQSMSHSRNTETKDNPSPALADRIVNNYMDLKSVIPVDLSPNKRKQSIKTFNKDKYV